MSAVAREDGVTGLNCVELEIAEVVFLVDGHERSGEMNFALRLIL